MQRGLKRYRNGIIAMTGLLIILAFITKWIIGSEVYATYLLLVASLIGGFPIVIQAYQALKVKVISIDLLVTLAIIGAFVIRAFEESAIVSFLFLFGAFLEQRTLAKTRSAIKSLVEMVPDTAYRQVKTGEFEEVSVDDINEGDILLVKTGSKIPVDGQVIFGKGTVNESSITGESIPVVKSLNSSVFAGTILENGTIHLRTEKVGEDTTFGKIIELVEEAQDSKSQAERLVDRFSKYYTPGVLIFAIMIWIFTHNIELAVTILVLGCPGALVIGVPVSNVSGIGNAARHGILFKGSDVITRFSQTNTMIFDKTGTLTYGNPQVSNTIYYRNKKEYIDSLLVSVEKESDHPLAKAIVNYYPHTTTEKIEATEVIQGGGIVAQIKNHQVLVGNLYLMNQYGVTLTHQMQEDLEDMESEGNSIVLTAIDRELVLILGIRDQIRGGVRENLEKLKKMGIRNLVLLSGDNQGTVDLVAKKLELTEAYGQLLPEDKAEYVRKYQKNNNIVTFIGDGINDSPSLALAHTGIAMGGGTDIAIETSNVVLMHSDFKHITYAMRLAKAIRRNMIENIAIALLVVVFLLASLLLSSWVNMAVGMFIHEFSILIVILNAMRLLKYK
ncbi:heavy metal translocating P-type ATPase [Staphylococcus sp. 17KM0847]|uniref:heavy metal translocating P-type ATPase n=1 Tax=Staphylococcus sp. 17KM0847 TaxID=2583989 RepID=UPI0015DCB996|nr:heavy metal translocating P-type ATPase [Staphylococcus sp. 17KM0847]QLK86402.1 heavy metal translocating P-type ATPase [Staphylococcus sp. 17KM0847]